MCVKYRQREKIVWPFSKNWATTAKPVWCCANQRPVACIKFEFIYNFWVSFWGRLILVIRFYRFYVSIRFDEIPVWIRLNQQNQIQFPIWINRFYAPICSNRLNIQIQSNTKSKQNETVTNAQTFYFDKKKLFPPKKVP